MSVKYDPILGRLREADTTAGGVTSVATRTGDVVLTESDIATGGNPGDLLVVSADNTIAQTSAITIDPDTGDVDIGASLTTTGVDVAEGGYKISGVALSASDVGADPAGTAAGAVTTHETTYDHTLLHAPGSDNQDLSGYQLTSQKAQANGYASLGADGKIPSSQLNPLAITSTFVVNSQASQLALTAQEGDVAVRTDLNRSYIHNGGTAGTMADWTEMLTPTDAVLSVDGQTGTVSLSSSYEPKNANIQSHIASTSNPHATTASQVGAVDKTGDTMTGELDLPSTEIGEKNPGYFNVLTNGTPYIYRAGTDLTDNTPLFILRRAKGSIASPEAVLSGYGIGTMEMGGYDGSKYTSGWNGGAGYIALTTEDWTSTAHGTKLSFNTTSNGSANWSTRMTIDESGYVGIGTTTPIDTLSIAKNATPEAGASVGVSAVLGIYGAGTTLIAARDVTNDIEFGMGTSTVAGGAIMGAFTNHTLQLRTNNTARLTISTAGDVGIGDTTPDGKLDVAQTSSTAAIPTLELEQSDLSEEFINFVTTVGTGNAIDTAAVGTYYGKARVAVNGTFKWLALYN